MRGGVRRLTIAAGCLLAMIQGAAGQSPVTSQTADGEPVPLPRPVLPRPAEPEMTLMAPFLVKKKLVPVQEIPAYEAPLLRFIRNGMIYQHVGEKTTTEILLDWTADKAGNAKPQVEVKVSW